MIYDFFGFHFKLKVIIINEKSVFKKTITTFARSKEFDTIIVGQFWAF